jgi:hypothetical protein
MAAVVLVLVWMWVWIGIHAVWVSAKDFITHWVIGTSTMNRSPISPSTTIIVTVNVPITSTTTHFLTAMIGKPTRPI